MSSQLTTEMLAECIITREKAFRDYVANVEVRKCLGVMSKSCKPWDAVLDPPKNTVKPFKPFKSYVRGLLPLSSQLSDKSFGEFTTAYPFGSGTEAILEKPESDRPKYHGRWHGPCSYNAKMDAALIIDEIDLASVGNTTIDSKQFYASRCNDEEGGNFDKCKVPSLQTLAGQVLQPSAEKLQSAYEEEKCFINSLDAAVKDAAQKFEDAVEKHQKRLQESDEAQEVKRLRLLLQQAEHRLAEKQQSVEKDIDEDREDIQSQFDQRRKDLAIAYIDKRDSLLSMSVGTPHCQGCTKPFTAQMNRQELVGWERCSVPGCSSRARFCADCSACPCSRCFAPLCTIHQTPHELVCAAECKRLCGYRYYYCYGRTAGIDQMDTSTGCCGNKKRSGSCWCVKCCVYICDECGVRANSRSLSFYCRRCSPTDDSHNVTNLPGMKWSGPEYKYERDRKRKKMEQFLVADGKCPPYERLVASYKKAATLQQTASGAAK